MGNQLFQFAYSLKIASEWGVQPRYRVEGMSGDRRLAIDEFLPGVLRLASPWELAQFGLTSEETASSQWFWGSVSRLCKVIPNKRAYAQRVSECVEPFALTPALRVAVRGYFQHPSCFEQHLNSVCQLVLGQAPAGLVSEEAVVMCVRGREFTDLGWALPVSYYVDALSMLELEERLPIRIVGDDATLEARLAERLQDMGWSVSDPAQLSDSAALNDFWTMVGARHLISANSTFSWWAGAVGDSRDLDGPRSVTIPEPWLVDFPNATEALLRPGWTALTVRP